MADATYEFGRYSLDVAEHRLVRDGKPVLLTPRVFAVLRVLVENAGHLVEKERLLSDVWNDAIVEEANLNRAVSVLRKTLGETQAERYIETVPKRGYRFVAPVRLQPTGVQPEAESVGPPLPTKAAWSRTMAVVVSTALVLFGGAAAYLMWHAGKPGIAPAPAVGPVHRQVTFTGKETLPALSPDGHWIAYVSGDSPNRRIIVQEVDGGPSATVFDAAAAGALRWSPDGADLLFWARGKGVDGLYIGSRNGGGARRIAPPGAFVTCWSPDGSTIAAAMFVSQKISLLNRLGEHQRTISLEGSRDWIWDLDWSSANNRILFAAMDVTGRASVWSIRSDGTDQRKLLSVTGEILAARWAPGDDAIYYVTRSNQTVSVFKAMVPPEGAPAESLPAPLVSGLEADVAFGISADASRLVYARAPYFSNLWLVEAGEATTRPIRTRQLTHGTSVVERPRVSPNGESIVFNMGSEWRTNLYTIPSTGGAPRQLTFFNAFSVGGAWDPAGRVVAFASTEGGEPRLWTVNADGGNAHPVSGPDMSPNYLLSWAPGKRLLYQRTGYRDFYALDPVSSRREPLMKNDTNGFISSADPSPDGKQLVLTWTGRRRGGLWLVNEDGSGERLILQLPNQSEFNPFAIGWSPDGSAVIAYEGRRAVSRGPSVPFGETITAGKVMRVPVRGGAATTLLELPFDEMGGIAMFPDGRRFVVSVYSSRSDVWIVDDFDVTARLEVQGRPLHRTRSP